MTRDELDLLRQRVAWLKPAMHIELPVSVVRELIAMADSRDDLDDATEPRCEACRKRPAPVDGGDGGCDRVWLCEQCAEDAKREYGLSAEDDPDT